MNIVITNSGDKPIYDQIYDRLKELIMTGEIPQDSPLPSIRGLAKDQRISVVTTKRAYVELEKDGFIYTIPGKGCFASKQNGALIREQYLREIEQHFSEALRLAALGGISPEELDRTYFTIKETY